ncbi:MAG: hypothetical protein JNL96_23355 [Planctomycetaceae bacterium]|nr:hypothetical protein [Planctomycetaceae bacterium]
MGSHAHDVLPADAPRTPPGLRKGALVALAVGAVGSVVAFAAGGHKLFISAYLAGYLFVLGVVLGSQALIYLHNLTGGQWGRQVRVSARAAASLLPLMALLFVPIALDTVNIYEWAHYEHEPASHQTDKILNFKKPYLNTHWFQLRAVGYFALWFLLAAYVRFLEGRNAKQRTFDSARRVRVGSAQAIGLYGVSMTFASIDWAMSLDPHWYSAAYGVIFVIGQALSAIAFNTSIVSHVMMAVGLGGGDNLKMGEFDGEMVAPEHPHHEPNPHGHVRHLGPGESELGHSHHATPIQDLGNLMLAFTMLWTYTAFSQFLIIWYGDLPEETVWYLKRSDHGWLIVGLMLVLLQYAAPFVSLMVRRNKRTPSIVGRIALGVVAMRLVDMTWQVMPANFSELTFGVAGAVVSTALLLGGVALYLFDLKMQRPAYEYDLPRESAGGSH